MKIPPVFIVDKTPAHANLMRYTLSAYRFPLIMVFGSVEECLYRLRREESPVFIISEFDLGDFNGFEFLKMIRKISPSSRVLFFSSHDDPDLASALISAGATDYVVKDKNLDPGIRELAKNLGYLVQEQIRQDSF